MTPLRQTMVLVAVAGYLLVSPPRYAHCQQPFTVTITQPAMPKFVKGDTRTWDCTHTGGDGEVTYRWWFLDDDDMLNGRPVDHTMTQAGEFTVHVFATDSKKNAATDSASFMVLWVTIGLSTTGQVHLDNGPRGRCAHHWYWTYTAPATLNVGPTDTQQGWKTGMEYVGTCTPSTWDRDVCLSRTMGAGGGGFWGGMNGNEPRG